MVKKEKIMVAVGTFGSLPTIYRESLLIDDIADRKVSEGSYDFKNQSVSWMATDENSSEMFEGLMERIFEVLECGVLIGNMEIKVGEKELLVILELLFKSVENKYRIGEHYYFIEISEREFESILRKFRKEKEIYGYLY